MARRYCFIAIVLTNILVAGSVATTAGEARNKPNIVVIFTDDHGYADLSCQGQMEDIATPHIDQLAGDGVRMTAGYVTAPQCIPSRAGILSGRYQQRFGVDHNGTIPMPLDEILLPQRLQQVGYVTGMVGKWHLDPNHTQTAWLRKNMPVAFRNRLGKPVAIPEAMRRPYFPPSRGFEDVFLGPMNRYLANYDRQGNDLASGGEWRNEEGFRLDIQSDAAVAFINRHHDEPFFLYLAYFAPHVPLQATEKYLKRFPGEMPERRRYALAMISAIDDGVGRIRQTLAQHHIDKETLIFFISDNGAPTKIDMKDIPISFQGGAWDGSRNDPWVGEKGMLSEGGIRVPYIVTWPETIPRNQQYHHPVTSLDVAATSLAIAGIEKCEELDGENLLPYLCGEKQTAPHESIYWRFWNQSAVREGKWKYLQVGNIASYLFDLESPEHEKRNLIDQHPRVAAELRQDLEAWASQLKEPGVPNGDVKPGEELWFSHYFGQMGDAK